MIRSSGRMADRARGWRREISTTLLRRPKKSVMSIWLISNFIRTRDNLLSSGVGPQHKGSLTRACAVLGPVLTSKQFYDSQIPIKR